MAYRQIHVKIWKDGWFIGLTPSQRLHFIYLFSNEAASISGIYELPMRVQSFETGLSLPEIESNLIELEAAGKIRWDSARNLVWVRMLRRYNANPSPKVKAKILKDLKSVPDCGLKQEYASHYGIEYNTISMGYLYGIDTVSKNTNNKGNKKEKEQDKEIEQEHEHEQEGIDRVSIGYKENEDDKFIFELYESSFGNAPGEMMREILLDALEQYDREWVPEAFLIAVKNNVLKWTYVNAILKRWKQRGGMSKAGKGDYLDDEFAEFIED